MPAIMARLVQELADDPVICAGRCGRGELEEASRQLGIEFPPDYCEFVERFGGAVVGSLPLFGVRIPDALGDEDTVVAQTLRARAEKAFALPEDALVISGDGFGNPLALFADGSVWRWDHDGPTVIRRVVAPTFEAFVVSLLDRRAPW